MIGPRILYVFWKIIGLWPCELSENGKIRFSYSGLCYSIALASVYFVCYVKAMKNRLSFSEPQETTMSIIADILAKSSQALMVIVTWVSFGFRQKRFRSLQKSFNKFIETCMILRIRDIPQNLIRNGILLVVVHNGIWGTIIVCAYYQHTKEPTYDFLMWIPSDFGRFLYPNFMITFSTAMSLIRDRFQSLNEAIGGLSRVDSRRQVVGEKEQQNSSGIRFPDESDFLSVYIRLHSQLVQLTVSVVQFLSVSIYFTMAAYILEIASSLYDISLSIKHDTFWSKENNVYSSAVIVWQIFHIIGLIALFAIPDSTEQEANRIGNVLHEFLTLSSPQRHIQESILQSLGLFQRPLIIQLFGVLNIKSSVISSISSLIISYITIMIQLDDQ